MIKGAYGTLTVIGKRFGVSGKVIGKWLAELGLRVIGKQPTRRAIELGLIAKSTFNRGTGTFPIVLWDIEKTVRILEAAGHRQVGQPA